MDNSLQVFSYNGNNVRTIEIDGEAWFVGKDVADILGYVNHRDAIAKHIDNEDKRTSQIATPSNGGYSDMIIINESGVYSLIFSSKLPTAKEFKHWVTSEVLPTIRKTGSYSTNKGQSALPSGVLDGARTILEIAGIKDNQLALALDKLYRSYTGKSALDTCGVNLLAPVKEQILTVTEIAKHFDFDKPKKGAQFINSLLEQAGYQLRTPNKLWEPTKLGEKFAVMLDTNKKHSDGTPVRSLKWNSGIISVIESLLHQ